VFILKQSFLWLLLREKITDRILRHDHVNVNNHILVEMVWIISRPDLTPAPANDHGNMENAMPLCS
jgi:hypothetical protein